ncbi:unnamed protein product [Trypanosoma congolense IL3000]|uniref:WGS project CAEQ00000000 data, annotated contig 656 n=1 Tax=Trypanosoma congolense (strain IL3000) TaxID=1068625 RepID=F9WHJ3_TRYCI|nr:unnamed protein product [Trypanosoma congolense IL3000]
MPNKEIEARLQKESKKLQPVGDRLRAFCFSNSGIEKSAEELQSIVGRLRDSKNQDILTKELPAFVNKLQDVAAQIPPSRRTESSEVLEELPLIEAEIRSVLDQLQDAMKGFQSAADRLKALCNREAKEVERAAEELQSMADRFGTPDTPKILEEERPAFVNKELATCGRPAHSLKPWSR